jgi:hypothetical protein
MKIADVIERWMEREGLPKPQPTSKVCDLNRGLELHADRNGNPYVVNPAAGGLLAVGKFVSREDVVLVEAWQADPQHDSLRARGDCRWQAACSFCAREVIE